MKRTIFLLFFIVLTLDLKVLATNFTVIPVNLVLYTNENTVVYADGEITSKIVLPTVAKDLPIQVTGITSTGFFQIMLDKTYYIPGNGLTNKNISGSSQTTAPAKTNSVKESQLAVVNVQRKAYGCSDYKLNSQLCEFADKRAIEISSVFSHTRPNGQKCFSILKENGYVYTNVGENIAYGQNSIEEVVTAWMNSEGHKKNILNTKFNQLGIGHYEVNKCHYWVLLLSN